MIKQVGIVIAANALGKSTKTLRRMIKDGRIKATKRGKEYLFAVKDIKNLGGNIDDESIRAYLPVSSTAKKINAYSPIPQKIKDYADEEARSIITDMKNRKIPINFIQEDGLRNYCYHKQVTYYFKKILEENAFEEILPNGRVVTHHLLSEMREHERLALILAKEYGLTLASAQRVSGQTEFIIASPTEEFFS